MWGSYDAAGRLPRPASAARLRAVTPPSRSGGALATGAVLTVLGVLLAYAHGAGNTRRLRRAVLASAGTILGIAAVFSVAVFLFRDGIFSLFSADPAVIDDGTKILTAMLVATLFNGLTGLAIALFQATAQMRNAAVLAVAQGVLFIPVVFGARALWGFDGVVWAMTITEALCLAAALTLLWASRPVLTGAQAPAGSEGPAASPMPEAATAAPGPAAG